MFKKCIVYVAELNETRECRGQKKTCNLEDQSLVCPNLCRSWLEKTIITYCLTTWLSTRVRVLFAVDIKEALGFRALRLYSNLTTPIKGYQQCCLAD